MKKIKEYMHFKTPEGKKIDFPVITVYGAEPGPRIVITAGIHGCEYPGIAAALALSKKLKPEEIFGTVVIVPIVSVEAFERKSPFVCPIDGKNLNRSFPGRLDGSYTEVQAYHILYDILDGADYHLDLHGGDLVEALEPFSICHVGGTDEIDRKSYELAYYYGLPNLVKTTWDGEWPDSGTTYANASVHGIPSAIVEAGGIGQMDQVSVAIHMTGMENVLRHIGVLKGAVLQPKVTVYQGFRWIYSPWKGIFYCQTSVGETVVKGQCLGYVENYFGDRLGDITATVDGKIVFLETTPAMSENGLVFGIAYM